jgi:thymidylate synthase (FAD)
MQKVDVLDHGFVRLVDHMGSDLSIVRAARVSYKQGRQELSSGQIEERVSEVAQFTDQCRAAFGTYRELLAAGWPRELARSVLPVSTYSHMFAKVDLRNLLHFLDLRCDPHAQYEIRVYADAILSLIAAVVPVTVAAWREGSAALSLARGEKV